MSVEDIGMTIRQRRKALKITQPNLAQLAKVATNTLYKIERGQTNPTLDIIEKIADVLGMELKLEVKRSG
ncbi:MAG: helix-turn-helix transcriptional regulator [Chitinophagaceae bacterium]|nr:helix-turn-helix transcriptional regulator [Chitinophagaceae bacterium]MCW5928371.1 helix-turn-helix transcriptional regulator [Chitinophagaceae bacterium]